MRTAYVDTLPRVMLIVKCEVVIGDEILLDYGKEYTDAYFG